MLITLAGMDVLITVLRRSLHRPDQAPYLAATIMAVATVILSFLARSIFPFDKRRPAPLGNHLPRYRLRECIIGLAL